MVDGESQHKFCSLPMLMRYCKIHTALTAGKGSVGMKASRRTRKGQGVGGSL